MRVLLLDEVKITKLTLPDEVDGIFTMKYKPIDSNQYKNFDFEAINDKWVLKSSDSFNIFINGNTTDEIVLEDYLHVAIYLFNTEEYLSLWCIPTISTEYYDSSANSNKIAIGSTSDSAIIFNNISQKAVFAEINSIENKWYINNVTGKTPLYVNDKIVRYSVPLATGDVIFIDGLKIIWMNKFLRICTYQNQISINLFILSKYSNTNYDNTIFNPVSDEEQIFELYHPDDYFFHKPSLKEFVHTETFEIDPPPPKQDTDNNSFLMTFGASFTMLSSSFIAVINLINNIQNKAKTLTIVTSAIMCVSMLFGSLLIPRIVTFIQKRRAKKREKYRIEKYTKYLNNCNEHIHKIMVKQAQIMKDSNLKIDNCINLVNGNFSVLWNREIRDEDFLVVRLGIGNVPALLEINAPQEHFTLDEDFLLDYIYQIVDNSKTLENVPVTFDFKKNRVSAILLNVPYSEYFLQSVIIQLATLHSSQELKMIFFINNEADDYDWDYVKYLPHSFNDDKTVRYYANSYDEMKVLSSNLEEILKSRKEKEKIDENSEIVEDSTLYRGFDNYYIIFINDIFLSKSLPIISDLLSLPENLGFSIVFLNKTMNKLPKRCNTFIALSEKDGCVMEKTINSQITFIPEYLKNVNVSYICSKLMNIPILSNDTQSSLPTSISFLDIFKVSRIEQLNIINRWKINDPTISLAVPIGVHANGEDFMLDLHEKAHGPHGLIAGSTGSGKSEFIITYILSLAVNFHPDEVQFVLIDYKGGGLAGAFENREKGYSIPHIAGTITNLDTASMKRSLVSINSELKRREQVFMDARDVTGESTLDIYKYQKYYREGIVKEPISHLFIISDEFAELKSQQPEFMNELISTARIGRSLGVHLILATQKPTGVVNDQIWANSKFKICLKVQTASDSNEMLKRPDAASIKEAGRFYLQVGYDEYFDIGQSGWSGAKYIPSDHSLKKVDNSITFINNVGSTIKNINDLVIKENVEDLGDQLTNIVKTLCNWSKKENYLPKRLWLDPIPEQIYLGNLTKKYNYSPTPFKICPIIGEYDNPKKQMQGLLTLDLNKGNTYIYGKNGSGKEDLISTIVYSTCITHSPDEVNIYIVDMGAGTLRSFLHYPQVGDVCTLDDGDKIIDLMAMAEREINKRKDLTTDFGGNFESYNEMNADKKLPLLVVIINNLDIFTENLSKIAELIVPLYRDGAKYGVVFIVSCIGVNTLRAKVREFFTNHISLSVSNKDDYFSILANYPRNLEPAGFKGRGLIEYGKDVLEFQSALIYTRNELNLIIKNTADTLNQKYKDVSLQRIPSIPKVVNVENFLDEITTLDKIPLGYNTENKEKFYFNFKDHKVNLISAIDFKEHLNFLNALVLELKILEKYDYDIKIIDFSGYFDILTIGLTCYQSNFNDTFGKIIEESNNLEKNTIYIITGIGKLKSNVDPKNMPFVNQFFKDTMKNQKINFIFVDTYEELNILKIEDWYISIVKPDYGIWLGKDVGTQTIINFNNLSSEDRMVNNPEYCFVAENGRKHLIKQITYKPNNDEGDE